MSSSLVSQTQNVPAPLALSQFLKAEFEDSWAESMDSLASTIRRITVKDNVFHLTGSGPVYDHPDDSLPVIILRAAPKRHKVYYKNSYRGESSVGVQPDVIWWADDPAPAEIPASALSMDTTGFMGYKHVQRLVVIPLLAINDSLDPYLLDIGSKSIGFGKDNKSNLSDPNAPLLTYIDLLTMCKQHSTQSVRVVPAHFKTTLVFDRKAGVTGVIRFVPDIKNGQLVYFNEEQLTSIASIMSSDEAKRLATVEPYNNLAAPRQETAQPIQTPVPQPVFVEPAPQPVPQPVFVEEPAPQPVVIPEPEPVVVPEPAPQPEPVVVPEPAPKPEPVNVPEPAPQPVAEQLKQDTASIDDIQNKLADLLKKRK